MFSINILLEAYLVPLEKREMSVLVIKVIKLL